MENCILDRVFNFDLEKVAQKIGLTNKKVEDIEYKEIIKILDYLDNESFKKEKVNEIIAISAIINEYYGEKYDGIKNILERILSRVGYHTSSKVLNINTEYSILSYLQISNNNDKYKIRIKDKEIILTEFQMEIWNKMNDSKKVIAISAPTSAGKSFIITLKLLEIMQRYKYDIIYVVPTISLVNQVSKDFNDGIKTLDIVDYDIKNSYIDNYDVNKRNIYVLTQEKLMQALTNFKNQFTNDLILVIDEIQNVEKISEEDEVRSKILLDSINDIKQNKNIKKIIISGPRINSINELGENLFGKESTIKVETKNTPVLNLTYSIKKVEKNYYLRQYNPINNKIYNLKIENIKMLKSFEKITYNDDYYSYLYHMINKLGKDSKNIIFAPTAKESTKIAKEVGEKISNENIKVNENITGLINYYKESVHEKYLVSNILNKNIVYHNGKMPRHVRVTLEYAIKKEMINNIVCTTTLMQGVNLPAQNILIRNPHLYTKSKIKNELSSYDMANLRGRAGRLLKDFVGRTYVYNEAEFLKVANEYNEEYIFSDTSKKIAGDYSDIFEENKNTILQELQENIEIKENMESNFLTIYIRHTILRYGANARKKLKDVGIIIDNNAIRKIRKKLKEINVPLEICKKNRYIDPFILDKMYKDKKLEELVVTNLQDKQATKKIRALLKYIRDNMDYKKIFEKNIPQIYRKSVGLSILSSKIVAWGKGMKLKEILGNNIAEDKIDDEISLLESTISYRIPSMLKPIYDIFSPESSILNNIELGACNPIIMCLIKMGIARETAIYLYEKYLNNISVDVSENELKNELKKYKDTIPYWIKVQLDFII